MKIEYMKNMLIDRLIGLDYIYTSDFTTKMKNYISDEEDIEKLKDLDGFVTDRVYLDYFNDNIQGKLDEHSMSIFEVKNMIKNNSREVVGEKESIYSGRDFSYRGGFNSGVVEKDIVRVEVDDTYKSDNSYEEDKEDEVDINSDNFYDEDDSEEDEIDIDLEEDLEEEDLEEEDFEEDDETDIDLEEDGDEIGIDLEEDDSEEDDSEDDDSEEDDEIDINLEEDEDDIDFDYEDSNFSGDDSDEDEIDIDLEEDDEDDIDIDIDLEYDEDIDVSLEDDEDDISTIHSSTPKPKENKQQHENRVKEKVFNNNFSNNTWDILNGAVDGVSNFFKRK